jgi:cyclopropane fatty-acyl-phospholipid synthase-like methyltransferase
VKRIHLGCGKHPKPMYINVDKYELPGVDVVHDLDKQPWPFDTEAYDEIVGVDIIEHVVNADGFMNECARILKPGGILNLRTCYYLSKNAFSDFDHKHFPTDESFDYWIKGTYFNQEYGHKTEGRLFEKLRIELVNGELEVALRRI